MYECFKIFNRKLPTRSSLAYQKNGEKRQVSSSAAPTTAVETPQPVPEPVSVELSEYEEKVKLSWVQSLKRGILWQSVSTKMSLDHFMC